MNKFLCAVAVFVFSAFALGDASAYVEGKRVALVIGNGAYAHAITLPNPPGDGKLVALPGKVEWISAKAEFTPTPVQTRDERADLVYAVKVNVPNERGLLKIGMPADLNLPPATART